MAEEESKLIPEEEATCCGGMCCCPSEVKGCMGDMYFPKRISLLVVLTLGMTLINAQRVNVGVTVVPILHKGASNKVTKPETMAEISSLDWTPGMVGLLHSIFYLGILISQIPCGYVVTMFPSTRLYGGCIFLSGLLNLLLPVSFLALGFVTSCAVRLTQGLLEGMLYPSCYDILRIWSLPEEKSRMGATVLTGSYIGPVLGMFFSGIITHYWGWQYVFYSHGIVIILWYIYWSCVAFEAPAQHPCISKQELELITLKQQSQVSCKKKKVPWLKIATSGPVWSLNICNFARSSVFYMLLTNQPTYYNLFDFTFVENGIFSALPFSTMSLVSILSGSIADLLMSHTNTTFVRKLLTCIGFGVQGVLFWALAKVTSEEASISILTVALAVSGLAISGWQINHLDIAPTFAGVLVAISMTFGTLAGVTNPLIVAALTKEQTFDGWHNVFWMTGSILIFSTIFYAIFASGEVQSWACEDPVDEISVYGTFQQKPTDVSPKENNNIENNNNNEVGINNGDKDESDEINTNNNNNNEIEEKREESKKSNLNEKGQELKLRHPSLTK